MKNNMFQNKESGFALITSLLVLVLLTIIGIAAINSSRTELNIAGNDKRHKIAFYAAESGIEAGRAVLNALKEEDTGYWDMILASNQIIMSDGATITTAQPNNYIIDADPNDVVLDNAVEALGPVDADGNPVALNVGSDDATFTLLIRDNVDLDNDLQVDTDNTLILTSTGTYGDAIASIQTVIRYTGNDQYAQEYYNTENTNQAGSAGDVNFSAP